MLLTVFTPTYNRANTIKRLFESLKNQTFKDFEWLIVDDGSTDNTAEVVQGFDAHGSFPIRYIRKENGGKHTAYNIGLEEARGDLFFNVDSDDWLDADCCLRISKLVDNIVSDSDCAGLIALKSFADGSIIGNSFREDKIIRTFRDLELSGQGGERSIVFRTSIARRFKFPSIEGERFMPEGVVYDEFKDCRFMILNECLTICEYLPEGLSSNPKGLMLRNPGAYMLYYRKRIDLAISLKERVGYVLRYNFFRQQYKGNAVPNYNGKHLLLVSMLKPINIIVAQFYKSDSGR